MLSLCLPGSPADKAGIEDTDIFESIEGQSTRDMSLPEIRNLSPVRQDRR